MAARIYRPTKTAMQSGRAGTKTWVLEYEPASPREVEPLMGWTSSGDMNSQIKLKFETREDAIAYAKRKGIEYHVQEPRKRRVTAKAYADNFKYGRIGSWTH